MRKIVKSTAKRSFELQSKQQFTEYLRALAWSPDSNCLAIVSAGGELALRQEETVNLLALDPNNSLDCVDFSGDGRWLAVAGQAGRVKIWHSATSGKFELTATIDGGSAWIDSLTWHPQKNLLAVAINREIKIWDAETQQIVADLNFEASSVFSLAWHPQGHLLAASGHGGVKVWQVGNWLQKPYLLEVPGASLDCAWSYQGKYLASGNLDRTMSILHWNNPPPWLMQGFPGKVSQVAWSQNGDKPLLATSCQEGIIIWQFNETQKKWQSQILQHQKTVRAIAFAPNSSLLASAGDDGCVRLWQQGKKLIQTLSGEVGFSCLLWHPTGKYLAAGSRDGELTIWQQSFASKGFG
ncbi:WD40 repeat domain-containing protein [Myxosarcina sp. GI1(2024)]